MGMPILSPERQNLVHKEDEKESPLSISRASTAASESLLAFDDESAAAC